VSFRTETASRDGAFGAFRGVRRFGFVDRFTGRFAPFFGRDFLFTVGFLVEKEFSNIVPEAGERQSFVSFLDLHCIIARWLLPYKKPVLRAPQAFISADPPSFTSRAP
jgi:hypothetical protein